MESSWSNFSKWTAMSHLYKGISSWAQEEYRKRKEKKFVSSDLWDHYFKCVLHDWISFILATTGVLCRLCRRHLSCKSVHPHFLSEYGIMVVRKKNLKIVSAMYFKRLPLICNYETISGFPLVFLRTLKLLIHNFG